MLFKHKVNGNTIEIHNENLINIMEREGFEPVEEEKPKKKEKE